MARTSRKRSSFSPSLMTSTSWVMFLFGVSSRLPVRTWMGSLPRNSRAMLTMDLGQVAVNMTVCLEGRICPAMDRSCGSKPMSSMRSASSSTRYVVLRRLRWPSVTRSMRRPGVPTTTLGSSRSSRICPDRDAPPKTTVARTRAGRENLANSAWICIASSRVGASTTTAGPRASPRLAGAAGGGCALTWTRAGRRKPSVLPLPVSAMPTTSRPFSRHGHAMLWTALGVLKFILRSSFSTHAGKPASVKFWTGGGGSRPTRVPSMLFRNALTSSVERAVTSGCST
mmetsp:Transcript_25316/g.63323  ORF Transcript_25316/g.63323 Transcript_25316/m.63323 type:complete len:284 (-) Transcript_25316:116-967(-)